MASVEAHGGRLGKRWFQAKATSTKPKPNKMPAEAGWVLVVDHSPLAAFSTRTARALAAASASLG